MDCPSTFRLRFPANQISAEMLSAAFSRSFATAARRPVYVVGVGMTKFTKPGTSGLDYPAMVKIAGQAALADSALSLDQIEQVRRRPLPAAVACLCRLCMG